MTLPKISIPLPTPFIMTHHISELPLVHVNNNEIRRIRIEMCRSHCEMGYSFSSSAPSNRMFGIFLYVSLNFFQHKNQDWHYDGAAQCKDVSREYLHRSAFREVPWLNGDSMARLEVGTMARLLKPMLYYELILPRHRYSLLF